MLALGMSVPARYGCPAREATIRENPLKAKSRHGMMLTLLSAIGLKNGDER